MLSQLYCTIVRIRYWHRSIKFNNQHVYTRLTFLAVSCLRSTKCKVINPYILLYRSKKTQSQCSIADETELNLNKTPISF